MIALSARSVVNSYPGSQSDFISVADTDRTRFAKHPWSIGGGGAAELKEQLDRVGGATLRSAVSAIGVCGMTNADDVMVVPSVADFRRAHIEAHMHRPLVNGALVRDWAIRNPDEVIFPYCGGVLESLANAPLLHRWMWPCRTVLGSRATFGKSTYFEEGRPWWEWHQLTPDRIRTPLSIVFAFKASHNHFCVDRGGSVFNRTAPMIKGRDGGSVEELLILTGLLNSAAANFWVRQISQPYEAPEPWAARYERDATKLARFPLPPEMPPVEIPRQLDRLAAELRSLAPARLAAEATPSRARLAAGCAESERILAEMVSAQEELDWTVLHLYGLTDEPLVVPGGLTAPPLQLGERAFEIILARKQDAGEVETTWFSRHRSTSITEIPAYWPDWYRDLVQRRIHLIDRDRDVALVERPEHKRRWTREPWETLVAEALQSWLAGRLEDRRLWFEGAGESERAVCRSLAQLADRVIALDPEFLDVARLWKDTVEIDAVAVIAELVADEHVPAQAAARYKGKGPKKRRVWEQTWNLQRIEDRGDPLPDGLKRIPVPPTYTAADFAKPSYWKQRKGLDVPKERFTSVAGAERDVNTDPTMVLAWAGFDHAELAQAITTLAVDRQAEGWDAHRIWPIVVAIAELLPWLDQWHADVDPRWGDSPAGLYRGIAEQLALAGDRRLADAATWAPTAPTKGRRPKEVAS